jgi:hypothetical protein
MQTHVGDSILNMSDSPDPASDGINGSGFYMGVVDGSTPYGDIIGAGPENSFWEVENSSLRDFPQEFRTFDIFRNSDNTIFITVTDVDPAGPAFKPGRKLHERFLMFLSISMVS